MNLLTISSELKLLLTLVDQWKSGNRVPDIEREIALDKLKMIYAQLKELTPPIDNFMMTCERQMVTPATSSNNLRGVFYEFQDEVAGALEPIPSFKAQPASAIEELVIPDFPILNGRPKETEEQPTRLTAEEASPILKSISSLADAINSSARPAEVRPEPKAPSADVRREEIVEGKRSNPVAESARVEETVVQPSKVETPRFGEVKESPKVAPKEPAAPSMQPNLASKLHAKPVEDIKKSISLNDKFFLIKELFKGDGLAYEVAINKLNSFESLDEALIYIQENYTWDASSSAAMLIVDLLQRKFI